MSRALNDPRLIPRHDLIRAGFIEGLNTRAQSQFFDRFLSTGTLADRLSDTYEALRAPLAANRLVAARRLRNDLARLRPLAEVKDPHVSGPIIEALARETDQRVATDLLHALRHLARRYFPDLRAREPLSARVGSANRTQRWAAGEALAYLRDERALEALVPLLVDRSELVRTMTYRAVGGIAVESTLHFQITGKRLTLGPAAKRRWTERLNTGLADSARDVRSASAGTLAALCGAAAFPAIEKAVAAETEASAREGLKLIIENTRRRLSG